MFDGKAFGVEIVGVVKSHVERTVAPLLAKIDALEKQIREMPVPKDGIDGKSITFDDVAPMIAEEVVKAVGQLRIPEDGKSIEPAAVQAMVDAAVAAKPPAEKGKDADPAETAAMIKAEVERAVAALPAPQDGKSVTLDDLRPVIAEAVAAIPVPKDGQPGKDGRDGLDVVKFIRDERGHLNGILRDGTTVDLGEYVGKDGAPGIAGKDGIDGVGFDDMSCEIRDDGVYLVWEKGEVVKEARLPIPMDRGVYKEGQTYRAGDAVTWGGSLWIAQGETTEKPDLSKDWRLSVKRGRDGKDAGDIKLKTKPVKG
jgi:hypothetical protein